MDNGSSSTPNTLCRILNARRVISDEATLVHRQRFTDLYLSRADDCGTDYEATRKIAIKRFKRCTQESKQLFHDMVDTWSKLSHKNVLELIGYGFETDESPLFLTLWMENGSSWNFVNLHPECDALHLIVGAARGLHYIHDMGAVHSDVKSENILISESGEAVICDFGTTRMVQVGTTDPNCSPFETRRYMAYEMVRGGILFTDKTDVWAFGMTIYELTTRERPYSAYPESEICSLIVNRVYPTFLSHSTAYPDDVWDGLRELCLHCWEHDPAHRIDMSTAVAKLSSAVSAFDRAEGKMPQDETHALHAEVSATPVVERPSPRNVDNAPLLEAPKVTNLHPLRLSRRTATLADLDVTEDVARGVGLFDLSSRINSVTTLHSSTRHSDIFRGHLLDTEVPVCIKRIRISDSSAKLSFAKEIHVWLRLKHENVVALFGYSFDDLECPLLITEWVERGCAWDFVRLNPDFDVFPLLVGITRGLNYLHDMNIVHSDIKGTNVLLGSSGSAAIPKVIITDIGMSRIGSSVQETSRWTAIELIIGQKADFTKASDVWAFGMTAYELRTRRMPYYQFHSSGPMIFAIASGLLPDLRSELSNSGDDTLKEVCRQCWERDPTKRATMQDILMMLSPSGEKSSEHDIRKHQRNCYTLDVSLRHNVQKRNIHSVRFSPDGERLAIACDKLLAIYIAGSGELEWESTGSNDVLNLCFSHDSSMVATSSTDRNIRVWYLPQREIVCTVEGDHDITCLAFGGRGRILAYGLLDGTVHMILTLSLRRSILQQEGIDATALSIAESPDGNTLAIGCFDATLRLWDWKSERLTRRIGGFSGPVGSVAFSPSGTWVVANGGGKVKKCHALQGRVYPMTYACHPGNVVDIAVSKDPNNSWVVSGADDGVVGIWSLENGELAKTLNDHHGAVISVDICSNSGMFATASQTQIRLWKYRE